MCSVGRHTSYGDISNRDVLRVTNMNSMFNGDIARGTRRANAFNDNVSRWDVSSRPAGKVQQQIHPRGVGNCKWSEASFSLVTASQGGTCQVRPRWSPCSHERHLITTIVARVTEAIVMFFRASIREQSFALCSSTVKVQSAGLHQMDVSNISRWNVSH